MKSYEVNFDGLVGPTHNYAGLSVGNVASLNNASGVANPKQGAKQGLDKMKALADMGLKQALLPPLERPDVYTLRRLGFSGSDQQVIESAAKTAPAILIACCSASSMWTANACTVSPSVDTADHKVHFTAANLANKFHRAIEGPATARILRTIFSDQQYFHHHQPLPLGDHFGDEGAANHTRLSNRYEDRGVEFFVFGKSAFDSSQVGPKQYPARQTIEASRAIARLHQLSDDKVVFAQQNPDTIDKGVFHNDVIAVGNQNTLFYHQEAFLNTENVKKEITSKFGSGVLHFVEVPSAKVSVEDAVSSYLFNSQLITLPDGNMALIAPGECQENKKVKAYLDELVSLDNPINQIKIFDVKQSMKNGGGPACLRQRVVLSEQEIKATAQGVFLTDDLYQQLHTWVDKHYRDSLVANDLMDPRLLDESRTALDELTQILGLGSIYPFQDV